MNRCEYCGVDFTGRRTRCPLCGSELVHEPPERTSAFPDIAFVRSSTTARDVLGAITLGLAIGTIGLWLAFGSSVPQVVAAEAALAVNYVFVRNVVLHRPDFMRMAQRYFLVLLAMALIWLAATGSTAAATFAIPGLCLVGAVFNGVLLAAFGGRFLDGYAKYVLFAVVLGILPLGLLPTGTVEWPGLCWASAACSAVLAASVLLFARRSAAEQARRLFHW